MKIICLGTGSPEPNIRRASSGYLIEIEDTWTDIIDEKISNAEHQFGSGVDDYDGFNHWKKNDIDVVYAKELDLKGIIKEELTIYNSKYKSTTDD